MESSRGSKNSVKDTLNLDSSPPSEDYLLSMQQDFNQLETVEENTDTLEKLLYQQGGNNSNIFYEEQIQGGGAGVGVEGDPPSPLLPFEVSSLFGSMDTSSGAHTSPPPFEVGDALGLEQLIQGAMEENYANKSLQSGQKSFQQRQRAVQEKNRKAQARFRERQKAKLSTLNTQLQDLNSKINLLSQQNLDLQNKNRILEKVLSIRDEQLFSVISARREKLKSDGLISKLPYEEEHNEIPTILTLGENDEFSEILQNEVFLSLLNKKFSLNELKNLSIEELSNIWKIYVNEFGIILVNLDENIVNDEFIRLEKLVKEMSMCFMRYGILNPIGIKKWVACRGNPEFLENNKQFEQFNQTTYDECMHIVRNLKLTNQQISETIQLRSLFFENIRKCSNQRQEINQKLQYSLPNSEGGPQTARRFLNAHESLASLKENLRLEHNILLDFVSSLYKRIFKPIQMAKMAVNFYPLSPDALTVAYCITQLPTHSTSDNYSQMHTYQNNNLQMHAYKNNTQQNNLQMHAYKSISMHCANQNQQVENNINNNNFNNQFVANNMQEYYQQMGGGPCQQGQLNQVNQLNLEKNNQNNGQNLFQNVKSVVGGGVGRTITTGVLEGMKFTPRRRR